MARSGIREIMNAVWGRPDVIRLEVRNLTASASRQST
jgi:hypothetical protein